MFETRTANVIKLFLCFVMLIKINTFIPFFILLIGIVKNQNFVTLVRKFEHNPLHIP